MILPMYNSCEKCRNTKFALILDMLTKDAKEGRIVCKQCGYNATATGWNHVNASEPTPIGA